ncbi:anhydro-N-acetylmuramic acid kinase [Pseudorhodoferax sp.]|uniref:anhydro-N-acetylmuramic acid kinase n=1 Tax=Pseudorhodoferax sp. TaxID=1993553 RepID=UPI0039E5A89F
MAERLIGLMSGTSLDGVDGVLALVEGDGRLTVHHHASRPFEPALRAELLALNTPGPDELHRAALAANGVARAYAQVVHQLLQDAGLGPGAVAALGAHGQTVRHQPLAVDGVGYTVQLLNAPLLAELAGIPVVADLRSRDLAAGGQGAPLVPPFHRAQFGQPDATLAVLNLGGISNLSVLPPDGSPAAVLGFDCGPGNALLDLWCQRHRGQPYDADGAWAAGGRVQAPLLAALRAEPYFVLPPPKSTGRDLFHAGWLDRHLAGFPGLAPADVQATLAALTAGVCVDDVRRHAPGAARLVVCGGGALNGDLMRRLQAGLPALRVESSAALGLPPQQVEAAAFAWLAWRRLQGLPGSLASVTGARGERVLGALHAA